VNICIQNHTNRVHNNSTNLRLFHVGRVVENGRADDWRNLKAVGRLEVMTKRLDQIRNIVLGIVARQPKAVRRAKLTGTVEDLVHLRGHPWATTETNDVVLWMTLVPVEEMNAEQLHFSLLVASL